MGQRCPSALEIVDWYNVKGEARSEVLSSLGSSATAAVMKLKVVHTNTTIQRMIRMFALGNDFEVILSLKRFICELRVPLPPL